MKFNRKYLIFIGVLLFSLNFFATVPSVAFSSDSFSQDRFNSFTWKFLFNINGASFGIFPDRALLRIDVVAAFSEDYGGILYDTLYLYYYNQTAGNTGWTPVITNEDARYNGTEYIIPDFGYSILPVFIPHNATAVVSALDKWYTSHSPLYNSSWIPGPNGYDGIYSRWNGLASGEVNTTKDEYKFNSEGIMEYYKLYNGTGSGWNPLFKIELQLPSESEIPGFSGFLTFLAFGLSLMTAIFFFRKKEIF